MVSTRADTSRCERGTQTRQRTDFWVGAEMDMRSKMTLLYYRRFLPTGLRVGWIDNPEARPINTVPR